MSQSNLPQVASPPIRLAVPPKINGDIESRAKEILLRHGFSNNVRLSKSADKEQVLYVDGIMSGQYFANALQEVSRELAIKVELSFDFLLPSGGKKML